MSRSTHAGARVARRRTRAAITTAVAVAATAAFAAPAQAFIEVDHGIEFVALGDLDGNREHTLTVTSPTGTVLGGKTFTTLADGSYEINHIGAEEGDCFDGATSPDIREGDVLTVSNSDGPVESYTVADVRYSTQFNPAGVGTPASMDISGWARSADTGTPIPAPEVRLQRGPFAVEPTVVGGNLDRFLDNRILITPDQDAAGAFLVNVSPITESQISEAILGVVEGLNGTSFSGDASFALPGCPTLDATRGPAEAPPLPAPPAPNAGAGAGGGGTAAPAAPATVTNTIIRLVPGPGAATTQVLGTQASGALRVSNLSLARRISITRLRLLGLRASMRLPQGTKAVRLAVYKARNGKKTGRALFTSTRTPASAGQYRVTLRNAGLLRKLRTGSYVMEVRAGRNAASLGTVTRIAFTVTR